MKCGGVRVVSGVKRMNNAQGAGGREEMKPAQQTLSLLAHLIRADLLDPNLCSWIFLATSWCCTEHTNTHIQQSVAGCGFTSGPEQGGLLRRAPWEAACVMRQELSPL